MGAFRLREDTVMEEKIKREERERARLQDCKVARLRDLILIARLREGERQDCKIAR